MVGLSFPHHWIYGIFVNLWWFRLFSIIQTMVKSFLKVPSMVHHGPGFSSQLRAFPPALRATLVPLQRSWELWMFIALKDGIGGLNPISVCKNTKCHRFHSSSCPPLSTIYGAFRSITPPRVPGIGQEAPHHPFLAASLFWLFIVQKALVTT